MRSCKYGEYGQLSISSCWYSGFVLFIYFLFLFFFFLFFFVCVIHIYQTNSEGCLEHAQADKVSALRWLALFWFSLPLSTVGWVGGGSVPL